MPKLSSSRSLLPHEAAISLARLGEHLALARARRKESQKVWASRMGVSVPTLIRMEHGDPGVGIGIYATALWMMGRANALSDIAAPEHDRGALEAEVRNATTRLRAVRSSASIEARLNRKPKSP
jgi:transcriptional regulator with XRE-family HTH domain